MIFSISQKCLAMQMSLLHNIKCMRSISCKLFDLNLPSTVQQCSRTHSNIQQCSRSHSNIQSQLAQYSPTMQSDSLKHTTMQSDSLKHTYIRFSTLQCNSLLIATFGCHQISRCGFALNIQFWSNVHCSYQKNWTSAIFFNNFNTLVNINNFG